MPKKEIYQDRMVLQCPEVYLQLSFLVETAAEKFITGVFQHQHAGIGDSKSQVDFEVGRIEARPVPVRATMELQTLSPIVVSAPDLSGSKMKARYLSPEEEDYKAYFLKNLIRKYESYASYTGNSISTGWEPTLDWELLPGRVKSRLETIKAGTKAESKVRGFDYRFRIQAPPPLMRIGLLAGFGEKNSLGFGFGEVTENR